MTLYAHANAEDPSVDFGIAIFDGPDYVAVSDAQQAGWGLWGDEFDTDTGSDADELLEQMGYRRTGDWVRGDFWVAEVEAIPENQIINLTTDTVTVDGVEFTPSGQVAQVEESKDLYAPTLSIRVGGKQLPVATVQTGRVVGLPDQQEGTYLIVSRTVAAAAPHRRDLLIPYEGGLGQGPAYEPLTWDDPNFGGMTPFEPHERRISRVDSHPVKAQVVAMGCPDHDAACGATATVTMEFGDTDAAREWAEDAAHRANTGTYTRR